MPVQKRGSLLWVPIGRVWFLRLPLCCAESAQRWQRDMLFSKFLTFPAMLSVTDHWCHWSLIVVAVLSIWPLDFIGTASYSNRKSYDGDPSHRPNGSQRIPAVQGWHHPSPDRYALGRGDASAVGEEQGAFVTFGPFGHEFLKNSGECDRFEDMLTTLSYQDMRQGRVTSSAHQMDTSIHWHPLAHSGYANYATVSTVSIGLHRSPSVSIGLHRSPSVSIGLSRLCSKHFETMLLRVASQGSHGSPSLRPDVHWSLGARRSTWLPKGILAYLGSWQLTQPGTMPGMSCWDPCVWNGSVAEKTVEELRRGEQRWEVFRKCVKRWNEARRGEVRRVEARWAWMRLDSARKMCFFRVKACQWLWRSTLVLEWETFWKCAR